MSMFVVFTCVHLLFNFEIHLSLAYFKSSPCMHKFDYAMHFLKLYGRVKVKNYIYIYIVIHNLCMYKVKFWLSCIGGIPCSILVSKKWGFCVATFGLAHYGFSFIGHLHSTYCDFTFGWLYY
jgi:hypothetical protein